ncbi:hypothetical protein O1611_g8812 [Lasiodiplodia mahajangana]|uniref:Uncharacterized protein n=1 Tax=Lasiodiplodia mahajangana TaxID=1108764 RepID=A0ACC2JBM4_9PEZI|nr:hypothetical protein O1611_g8812 [Lasiodiplodia mahajangana]
MTNNNKNNNKNTTYKAVQAADSDDELGDEESKSHECPHCYNEMKPGSPKRLREGANAWLTWGGWANSIFLIFALVWWVWYQDTRLESKCIHMTSSYSPLLSEVPNILTESRRNGSIRWPSPYRGEPSYEVDKAWEEISIFRPLDYQLTDEEYLEVGISPETAARNAPEFGGGFFLQPEFSHQNLLRKASHFKYGYYKTHDPDFTDKDETFKVHLGKICLKSRQAGHASSLNIFLKNRFSDSEFAPILTDHCVEMLRQFVMCHAEVGLVTAHWIEQRARPWPDFNTKQICRDFNGVLKWTREHQLPESAPMMPLRPEGAKALSSPP